VSEEPSERPEEQHHRQRRVLEPFTNASGSRRHRSSHEERRDRRIKWWDRNWGYVSAATLGVLTFVLILMVLQLFSGS